MKEQDNLLRLNSRELGVEVRVRIETAGIFLDLSIDNESIGSRRLNKGSCCSSDSPCIGWVQIDKDLQQKHDLPPFIHVSLCYDEIMARAKVD